VASSVSIVYVLFYSGYVGWRGGWCFGPRYLVPILPFAAFPIAFARFRTIRWTALFLLSAVQVWLALLAVPHIPEIIANPLVDTVIPCLAAGYSALNAGLLFGNIGPLWSLLTICVVAVLAVTASKLSGRDGTGGKTAEEPAFLKALYTANALAVMAALAAVHTEPPGTRHIVMHRLLYDAARITHDEGLMLRAMKYRSLAELDGPAAYAEPALQEDVEAP
jgi:hypothetical protein